MTLNQKPAAPQGSRLAAVALPALLRLALLVLPLVAAVVVLGKSPVICVVACAATLWVWLSVDVGPFRAAGAVRSKPAAKPSAVPSPRNFAKAQWWNSLFCRLIILSALFYSKLNI